MKKIIYNEHNLEDSEINNIVKRAKIILINKNDEILLANSKNNYYLVGGHVDNNETDIETLKRETLEETGIDLNIKKLNPFFTIIYKTKDYPEKNINSEHIANYYYLKLDEKINYNKIHLTEEEIKGNFKVEYIHINNILKVLNDSLSIATRPGVVRDTIIVIEEFIKIYK